jgi:EAL domain-containing protein (putative c-di-GMP-specific phosphodiesterase class I)
LLHEACRRRVRWQGQGLPALRVAVNISAASFATRIAGAVMNALRAAGMEARHLELELTESIIMEDASARPAC